MAVEVEVEEMEEVEDEVTEVEVQGQVKVRVRTNILDTRRPGMPTYPRSSPVSGTGHMGSQLIFVWSLAPAPGSSIGYPSQIINEIRLNSHKRGQSLFTIHYQTDFQK